MGLAGHMILEDVIHGHHVLHSAGYATSSAAAQDVEMHRIAVLCSGARDTIRMSEWMRAEQTRRVSSHASRAGRRSRQKERWPSREVEY